MNVFDSKLWLVIGIPTVPRRNDTDYLTPTLASVLDELPLNPGDSLYNRVKIIVMNNRPNDHIVYTKVKLVSVARLSDLTFHSCFVIV